MVGGTDSGVGMPGAIVTGSASNTGLRGETNRFPYAAAKAGVINMVRSVAIDLGPSNIRVNAVRRSTAA